MKKQLTKKEKKVIKKLVEAHNLFIKLEGNSENKEWCESIHKLQDLVGLKLLRRIHPEIYK